MGGFPMRYSRNTKYTTHIFRYHVVLFFMDEDGYHKISDHDTILPSIKKEGVDYAFLDAFSYLQSSFPINGVMYQVIPAKDYLAYVPSRRSKSQTGENPSIQFTCNDQQRKIKKKYRWMNYEQLVANHAIREPTYSQAVATSSFNQIDSSSESEEYQARVIVHRVPKRKTKKTILVCILIAVTGLLAFMSYVSYVRL